MKDEGGRRKERPAPARLPATGWSRVTLVIVLLAAILAFVAWNVERGAQTPPAVAGNVKPQEQSRKPAPRATDARDFSRERPERERTDRPGEAQPGKN
jgi:hypothetical protein